MPQSIDIADRVSGLLIGTAVGDAIGLPRESMSRRRAVRLFGGPPLEHRLIFGRGMVSDDTEHACMTAASLLEHPDDPERFGRALAGRLRTWFLSLSAGIGMATARACLKLWLGWPPQRSGVWSAGNGPAMRAPVIGAFLYDRPDQMRDAVRMSTRLTHTDPKAEEGAWVVATAASVALRHMPETLSAEAFIEVVLDKINGPELKQRLAKALELLKRNQPAIDYIRTWKTDDGVSGYINETVPAAIYCWLKHRGDVRRTVEEVVMLGGDADTTGAIAGALAGATSGRTAIPRDWIDGLWEWPRTVTWIDRLAERLMRRMNCRNSAERIDPPNVSWCLIPIRNVLFLSIVLGHGLRRLLPPY